MAFVIKYIVSEEFIFTSKALKWIKEVTISQEYTSFQSNFSMQFSLLNIIMKQSYLSSYLIRYRLERQF